MPVVVKGLDELRRNLAAFSDRRFAAMVATGLTRTGIKVRDDLKASMRQSLAEPKPYTVNALVSRSANAQNLVATVEVRPDSPALKYLLTQVHGASQREQKQFEKLAGAFGLPAGWLAVPAPGVPLDRYGNMTRAAIKAVFNGLTGKGKAGKAYFVLKDKSGTPKGIYARAGRQIKPVLLFTPAARYSARWNFYEAAQQSAAKHLPAEMQRAVQEAIERFRKAKA